MPYNPLVPVFTDADVDAVKAEIIAATASVDALNTINVALLKEERGKGSTVGPKRKPYEDFFYINKGGYAQFMPAASATKVNEVNAVKHYNGHKKLGELTPLVLTLMEKIVDLQLNGEHFAFHFASKGRLSAKDAVESGQPGADSWFDELDALYPQRGPGEEDDE